MVVVAACLWCIAGGCLSLVYLLGFMDCLVCCGGFKGIYSWYCVEVGLLFVEFVERIRGDELQRQYHDVGRFMGCFCGCHCICFYLHLFVSFIPTFRILIFALNKS